MIEERYEIITMLGKGRTGGVYEAHDSTLGRKVALRRFFSQGKQIELSEYKEDFLEVAQSLSALQHPNLLRVYDAGVDDDGAYIISQLLKGETLQEKTQAAPLTSYEVFELAQQMLDALCIAHAEGFIHGAITPGSIHMTSRARGGYLHVILDTGLSRLAPLIQGKDSILSMMADPAILAPELFNGGTATERADLYMLGNILYMSLAGGHPFGGVPAAEAEKMHAAGLPPLQNYAPNTPENLRLWIEKLTQYNPDERPSSAAQALNCLPKLSPITNNTTSVVQVASPKLITQAVNPVLTGSVSTNPNPPASNLTANIILPSANKKDSKKAILITLALTALVTSIVCIIALSEDNDKPTEPLAPQTSDIAKTKTNKPKKRLITHFDATKPPIENQGWEYINKTTQAMTANNDGWRINYVRQDGPAGINYNLKPFNTDMFSLGWKLTYVVRATKGTHRFGFNFPNENNPGWDGDDICLFLTIQKKQNGEIVLSSLDSEAIVKPGKSVTAPDNDSSEWHTIVIQQQPETKSGYYTVSINGTNAFVDKFTRNKIFTKKLQNHF